KRACEAATGKIPRLTIFGTDYDTPDGTGVRDFIHVSDLVDIHKCVLERLRGDGSSLLINCGYGRGFSVRQVVAAVERVSGKSLAVELAPRRPGDLGIVVADTRKLAKLLNWNPRYDDLDKIVETALGWERRLGN
ncbi:MAG TPA: NAD-dependent epimerase/dehydratase family protein, partial [Rhizorhapis sp.]|nr:NAD-dependent epimerase/dehydratase family protein [Rhizorhapis sp.]